MLALDKALLDLAIKGLVVGLGGVWAWRWSPKELQPDGKLGKGKSRPIPELDDIRWAKRVVHILFDSDVASNWKVGVAETALARELDRRLAYVQILRIPEDTRWKKSASTTRLLRTAQK